MEDELIKKLESLEPQQIEVPSHRQGLKRFLIQKELGKNQPQHSSLLETLRALMNPFSRRSIYIPFLASAAVMLVIILVLVLAPGKAPSDLTASQIALNDSQVRTALKTSQPNEIQTQELAGENSTCVVMLSSPSNMVIVGVDMVTRKVTEWLYDASTGIKSETGFAPQTQYQIFFLSTMNGLSSIYVINTDGTQLTKITENDGWYGYISWSQTNQKLAFISDRSGKQELYISNADGTDMQMLTNLSQALSPQWSPDGSRIAFAGRDGHYDLFVIDSDGSNLLRLTNDAPGQWNPCWSPDGKTIAFGLSMDGNSDIFTINADGSNLQNLTQSPGNDYHHTWSTDGEQIAFDSIINERRTICIINSDGTGFKDLTESISDSQRPVWSPDGQKLLFYSENDGDSEIYVVNSDGSNLTKLTDNDIRDRFPSWSPDGKFIVYYSQTADTRDFYTMGPDGTNRIKIVENISSFPVWAQLAVYPAPVVPQDEIIEQLPLPTIPVTTVILYPSKPGANTLPPEDPTLIPPPPSVWPISTKEQAIAIAAGYLPVGLSEQATVGVGVGWSGPGLAVGEPRWRITFSNISVTREELGWEPRHEVVQIDGVWVLLLPTVELLGKGPYVEIIIEISGLDGGVRQQFALTVPSRVALLP
jgi:TolB protein